MSAAAFNGYQNFNKHFQTEELTFRMACDICKKTFSCKRNLRYHMFSHFPEEYLICEGCKKTCKSLTSLKKHIRQCKKFKKNHLPSVSNGLLHNTSEVKAPRRTVKEFLCHICCQTFKTSFALIRHIDFHNKTHFECDLCKRNFSSKLATKLHMYSHFPEEYLTCKGCLKNCKTDAKYRNHVRRCEELLKNKMSFVNKNGVECYLCCKKFLSKDGLRQHMYSHFPEEYLNCNGCKLTCATATLFRKHVQNCDEFKKTKTSYQNENPLQCEYCVKKFFSKSGLRRHRYSHFPEKYLTCIGCKTMFKNISLFNKHMSECSHVKMYNFHTITCDLCGRNFSSKPEIRRHMFSHFPRDYLSCGGCKKMYQGLSTLILHTQNCGNLNKNALKCELCGKNFATKFGLERHIYSHFPEEYLTCKACKTTFKSMWCFRKHVRSCVRDTTGVCECDSCGKRIFCRNTRNIYSYCEVCKKAFKSGPFTKKQSRKCNKPMKKFECRICYKTLKGYSNCALKRHLSVHSKKKIQKNSKTVINRYSLRSDSAQSETVPSEPKEVPGYVSMYSEDAFAGEKASSYCLISEIEIKEEII